MLISKKITRLIASAEENKVSEARELIVELISDLRKIRNSHPAEELIREINKQYKLNMDETLPEADILAEAETSSGFSIYIVTPTYNSAETIANTITSVINQGGDMEIHYHVQDGGSTDGTLNILENFNHVINEEKDTYKKVTFTYSSEPDNGMYDAIAKGFEKILPENNVWMGWINSDDTLADGALEFISEVVIKMGSIVSWITGIQTVRVDDGSLSIHDVKYSSELISKGLCDGNHWWFLQQEGTFWRKGLWDSIDKYQFRRFKYAGDWSLWYYFANKGAILFQARRSLGIFHVRHGQLSQSGLETYMDEIDSIVPLKVRRENFDKMRNNYTQIYYLEKMQDCDGLLMSSYFIEILGEKDVRPATHKVLQ